MGEHFLPEKKKKDGAIRKEKATQYKKPKKPAKTPEPEDQEI